MPPAATTRKMMEAESQHHKDQGALLASELPSSSPTTFESSFPTPEVADCPIKCVQASVEGCTKIATEIKTRIDETCKEEKFFAKADMMKRADFILMHIVVEAAIMLFGFAVSFATRSLWHRYVRPPPQPAEPSTAWKKITDLVTELYHEGDLIYSSETTSIPGTRQMSLAIRISQRP